MAYHNENHGKKMAHYFFIFRRFWIKEPRHSEKYIRQKEVHLNCSMRLPSKPCFG